MSEIAAWDDLKDNIRGALFKIEKAIGSSPASIPPPTAPSTSSGVVAARKVKLPELSLSHFDGEPTKWYTFWDTFESIIHNNSELTDVNKFTYLRSLLHRSAKDAVAGLSLTAANYKEAIDVLQRRFGDKSRITAKHMQALMSLEMPTNSLQSLRHFFDNVGGHIRGLKALGVTSETYGALLCPVVMESLPQEMRVIISRKVTNCQSDLDSILDALLAEIEARERVGVTSRDHPQQSRSKRDQSTGATLYAGGTGNKKQSAGSQYCCYCQAAHTPITCPKVTQVEERKQVIMRQGRCFNCLRRGHLIRDCKTQASCKGCNSKHHPSICRNLMKETPPNETAYSSNSSPLNLSAPSFTPTTSPTLYIEGDPAVLLQTAQATVFNPNRPHISEEIRVIFDCGSQQSYVTDAVKRSLSIRPEGKKDTAILTFGSKEEKNHSCDIVKVGVCTREGEPLEIRLLSVPLICSKVSDVPLEWCKDNYEYLNELDLADASRGKEPALLIGSDYYWRFVTGETVRSANGPVAVHTRLGWVISGPVDMANTCSSSSLYTHVLRVDSTPSLKSLDNQLKAFWDLESFGVTDTEDSVYDQFSSNIVMSDGRYEVSLPWKDSFPYIPDNLLLSQGRLRSLLKRLKQSPDILREYDCIIRQQLESGIIETVEDVDQADIGRVHYLPHHAVI